MKSLKLISTLILGIFLISFVSAITVSDGLWTENGLQSITINDGENVNFEAGAYIATHSPLTLNVEVYSPNIFGTRIHSFPTESSSNNGFYKTYTITPSIYANPGTYEIIISSSDNDGSGDADYYSLHLTVNLVIPPTTPTPDTTAPVIILTGSNPQTIIQGTSYIELGATATDDIDGDLTSSIIIDSSAVDISTVALYLVTYSVSDSSGNSVTVSRLVNVIEDGDDEDDEDEDEEEEDDDEDNETTRRGHSSRRDSFEDDAYYQHLYFSQFDTDFTIPKFEESKPQLSWFQKLINTLVAFFKWIFRLE